MSIRVTEVRPGRWQVDIRGRFPDGTRYRDRRRPEEEWIRSRTAALTWGRDRERTLFDAWRAGPVMAPAPTLADFAPRVLESARGNRQKPSQVAAKESILRFHLVPMLGETRLDAIRATDIERIKAKLADRRPHTVNNVLAALGALLRQAVEWGVIERMPCAVKLIRTPKTHAAFHDFESYGRLVEAAGRVTHDALLVVLLGGDAGLRAGEMRALKWTDVDMARRQIRVQRSLWKSHETAPKGGRPRAVPMTARLAAALAAYRHLRGVRVLCGEEGQAITMKMLRTHVRRAARLANIANDGIHVLRHSFVSHLAMRGAPVRAIQELAGHADLTTTQRYMHLSPAAVEDAIRLLEAGERGNVGATARGA